LPEVVRDSGGGIVYRDDEELLAAIHQITTSPSLRNELGENGYQGFVRWWTREAHLERYFGFLRSAALRKFERVPWEEADDQGSACAVSHREGACP